MTNPKDNEEVNEELSTQELKSVSGGTEVFEQEIKDKIKSVTKSDTPTPKVLTQGQGGFKEMKKTGEDSPFETGINY